LNSQSGLSQAKLYRVIGHHLQQPLPAANLSKAKYVVLDGTFIHRPKTVIALMDAGAHTVVAGEYGVSESSEPQLRRYLSGLKRQGLCPQSFTIDGNPHVMKTLRALWPDATIQRCLVHIQRQGLSWCRTSPKTAYARQLRHLFLRVTKIGTFEDRDRFLLRWRAWEDRYGPLIRCRRESGPVFSDIKRARSMLIRALPNMFPYLDDCHIPTSTNGLEGYFSRLKQHYRSHRGLSQNRRGNYFRWYLHLVPK
jgi:hypothetical protein